MVLLGLGFPPLFLFFDKSQIRIYFMDLILAFILSWAGTDIANGT